MANRYVEEYKILIVLDNLGQSSDFNSKLSRFLNSANLPYGWMTTSTVKTEEEYMADSK